MDPGWGQAQNWEKANSTLAPTQGAGHNIEALTNNRRRFDNLIKLAEEGAFIVVVLPMHRFSALAGGFALGIIMIPLITRTTEEMLRLVPSSFREAGLGLGIPRWKTTLFIILPAAFKGIFTGVFLSIARAAGETAPLLFTALGNRFWSTTLDQPMASMTVFIYDYARAPFDDWNQQAWAASFILIVLVLIMNVLFRLVTRKSYTA